VYASVGIMVEPFGGWETGSSTGLHPMKETIKMTANKIFFGLIIINIKLFRYCTLVQKDILY